MTRDDDAEDHGEGDRPLGLSVWKPGTTQSHSEDGEAR